MNNKTTHKYPKILLTGGSGQLGLELQSMLQSLGEVWSPSRKIFNLANPESLRQKIRDYQPDLIVNAAAYTEVDQAELDTLLAYSVNVESPRVLAEEASNLGIPIIHYSTDYVFDGGQKVPYAEGNEPHPINIYGKTKLKGERAIQESHNQYLILRTSWLYSSTHGKNFYTTMLRLFKEKEIVHVVNDQIGRPTSVGFLAGATFELLSQLSKKENEENRWGVYHLAGEEQMSWYDFAKKIYKQEKRVNIFKVKKILPISYKDYVTKAVRPNYSVLNCDYIQQKFGDIYKKDCYDKSRRTTKPVYLIYFMLVKILTPFLILTIPSFISWFLDFGKKHRRLPARQDRIKKKENVLDEFIFFNYDSLQFDEVNICMRGSIDNVKNPNLPTFFINPYKSIPSIFKDKYYVTSDRLIFKAIMGYPDNNFYKRFNKNIDGKTMYVMPYGEWLKNSNLEDCSDENKELKLKEVVKSHKDTMGYDGKYFSTICAHKYKGGNIQIGSGILCVLSTLQLSKKVNVYGWDAFLDDDMPNGFIRQTMKLWSKFDDFHPGSRFSAIVLNWIYAYRLINEFDSTRLTVHGRVNEVSKLRWIKKYLFKVIYK
jgi:dTDP-4-dehydrorhamnose reductase